MAREKINPAVELLLPNDVIDQDGNVSRGGIVPVDQRREIHSNRFGLLVVRDLDSVRGGVQDVITYRRGTDSVTAVMMLPVDDKPDEPEVVLIEGFQYGLGKRTLEAPGARVIEGETPPMAIQGVEGNWGINTAGLLLRGERDDTSGRQYNVTATYEAKVRGLSQLPHHLVRGEGERRSVRVTMPLQEAYHLADSGKISNSLTSNLIYRAVLARR